LRPAIFDRDSATLNPAELPEALRECGRSLAFAQGCALTQKADGRQLPRLLRTRRERPRRHAAEQRDEAAPFHSSTSSAATSSLAGTVRPSALALLRLITNSYLVGCCTGKSTGFVPRRMRST